MTILPKALGFIQGDPFYDSVGAYVTSLNGIYAVAAPDNLLKFKQTDVLVIEGKVHKELRVSLGAFYDLVQQRKLSIPSTVTALGRMLLVTAYAEVEDRRDLSPLFEFFRHVRNASAHDNKFNFRVDNRVQEPRRLASWRSLAIDHSKKGASNPLHGTRCFPDFLGPADPILLLWDVKELLRIQLDSGSGESRPERSSTVN